MRLKHLINFYLSIFSYIKLSSPKLNNVMVIGAMHIHIAILLFGLDQWFLEHNILGHACMVNNN
jgi:hypothetical protein